MIQERGRRDWQKAINYGRRSLGEVAMMRYKTVIGRRLYARLCRRKGPKPRPAARSSTS